MGRREREKLKVPQPDPPRTAPPVSSGKRQPLSRSNIESYGFGIIAIVLGVFPMTWWLRCLLIAILCGLVADLVRRHPRTINWGNGVKVFVFLLIVSPILYLAFRPIHDDFVKSHPRRSRPFSEAVYDMFDNPCDKMVVMPYAREGSKNTIDVSLQLMPPTCDDSPKSNSNVLGMAISFINESTKTDHNVRLKLGFGNSIMVSSIDCPDGDRLQIIEGPGAHGESGRLYIVAKELFPDESHSCMLKFEHSEDVPTVAEWNEFFRSGGNWIQGFWSDNADGPHDVLVYRVNFGMKERTASQTHPFGRKVTFMVK